jgi:hypothetical protein
METKSPLPTLLCHTLSAIPVRMSHSKKTLAPYTILQDPMFIRERLLQRNHCIMSGNALRECYRGVEAQ